MVQQNNQSGQGQGQSQGQGQGNQLGTREMLQIGLNETKHMAQSLNTYILEVQNEQLRRDYMTILGDLYGQEKQIFDIMQQKGYYNVKNASPQDITQAQNKFSAAAQQQNQQQNQQQSGQQMQ